MSFAGICKIIYGRYMANKQCSDCLMWEQTTAQMWGICSHGKRFRLNRESCEFFKSEEASDVSNNKRPEDKVVRLGAKPKALFSSHGSDDLGAPALYAHQKEAVERFSTETEIALFMDCGLGKSCTVLNIAANKFRNKEIDSLLIIAPNGVHLQWASQEIPLWLNVPYDIQCLYGRGGNRKAYPFEDDPDLMQIICVNVDTFSTPTKWKDIVQWANLRKTFIVLDEATCVKNINAQRTQHILYSFNETIKRGKTMVSTKRLSAARAILTGTPVTNGAMDLWSLFEFLRPNYFNRNWYSFQNHFGMFTKLAVEDRAGNARQINVPLTEDMWNAIKRCRNYEEANCVFGCSQDTFDVIVSQPAYEGPYKHADELKELIKPVSLFKVLKECVDMPPQNYVTKKLVMNDEIRECYESMIDELIAEYEGHEMTAANKLSVLLRLQQISSGFLFDQSFLVKHAESIGELWAVVDQECEPVKWIGNSNPKLEQLYEDVNDSSRPVIIITRFTAEASRIFNDLSDKYSCCLVTGWKKVGTIEEFQEGKYQVMVANIAAIAHGFNLQNSCVICFYSNTFSLELRLQAEGRIFRINQKKPCVYIDYIYADSVDEKITGALLLKRNLLDYVRGAEKVKELV